MKTMIGIMCYFNENENKIKDILGELKSNDLKKSDVCVHCGENLEFIENSYWLCIECDIEEIMRIIG